MNYKKHPNIKNIKAIFLFSLSSIRVLLIRDVQITMLLFLSSPYLNVKYEAPRIIPIRQLCTLVQGLLLYPVQQSPPYYKQLAEKSLELNETCVICIVNEMVAKLIIEQQNCFLYSLQKSIQHKHITINQISLARYQDCWIQLSLSFHGKTLFNIRTCQSHVFQHPLSS